MAKNRTDLEALLAAHNRRFRLEGGGQELVLKGEDLRGIDLSGADLAGVILSEVRLDEANMARADLYAVFAGGSSFVGADFNSAQIVKADFAAVIARKANFTDANLMRTGFFEADLRGARFDRTTLTKTSFHLADLRGCSFQGARFDRTSFHDAILGNLDAAGASGTILPGPASIETPDGLHSANEDEVLAYLRAAGADVSFWLPPKPPIRSDP
jgi:uncharacterized protein YjbI with pentapeptide repeats